MNGQWLGIKHPTGQGREANLIVNLDRVDDRYEGLVIHWPIAQPTMCAVIPIRVPASQNPFVAEGNLLAYTGQNDVPFPFFDASHVVSTAEKTARSLPRRVYIEGDWNQDRMRLSFTSDLGFEGHAIVHRMGKHQESRVIAPIVSWQEIKDRLFSLPYRKYIFRGQSDSRWPLRSLLHREGHAELYRYLQQDAPIMYRRLSGALSQPLEVT